MFPDDSVTGFSVCDGVEAVWNLYVLSEDQNSHVFDPNGVVLLE